MLTNFKAFDIVSKAVEAIWGDTSEWGLDRMSGKEDGANGNQGK